MAENDSDRNGGAVPQPNPFGKIGPRPRGLALTHTPAPRCADVARPAVGGVKGRHHAHGMSLGPIDAFDERRLARARRREVSWNRMIVWVSSTGTMLRKACGSTI